jgi:photosystem II stability/assembly factor-like uncharacterized protein
LPLKSLAKPARHFVLARSKCKGDIMLTRRRKQAANRKLSVTPLDDRIAPSGVPAQWSIVGAGGGGALYSPQFNPANPSEIYVASDMSQVFHTTNAGASWQELDFRQIEGGPESQVQFTDNPNIRYAIDYSPVNGDDEIRPSESTDGGVTWHALANDPTGGGAFYLYANPSNHNQLVVTDYTNLYFSGDGGQTWAMKYTAADSGAGLLLSGAFWDGSNIYLGTNDGVLVSSNSGTSFSLASLGGLPAGQVIISFAGAKQGTTTRFLAVTLNSADTYSGLQGYDNGGGENVATLDWGSSNWTVRSLGDTTAWPFYAGMSLSDINTMYVAGSNSAGVPTVFKSTNAGQSWTSVLRTDSQQNVATGWSGSGGDRGWTYGQYALGFAVASNNSNQLIITDLGFAHSSSDGGTSWQALYVIPADRNAAGSPTPTGHSYQDSGLDNTTSWGVAWASASNVIIANTDIKAQISTNGGQTFGFGYTGDNFNTMFRVILHPNGNLYAAVGSRHDLYQSTTLTDSLIDGATGEVLFSTNQGAAWQVLHNFNHEVVWVAADPTNSNRLYAAVADSNTTIGGIWVTNNLSAGAASTWTELPTPPRTQGHPDNIVVLNDGSVLASFSARRATVSGSTNFTNSSGVFLYNPSTQTWADRSAPGLDYWTKDVVVDPNDPTQNTWYAGVYSGWGGQANGLGGLYKTTNRGQTWTLITSGLDVESITFNPAVPTEAFMTTETQGLWYSSNMQSATPTFTQVANYPFRQPERVFFNPYNSNEIWVTSFGGGVMVGETAVAPSVAAVQVNDGNVQRSEVRTISVTFSGPVTFAGGTANAATAFQLQHVTDANDVILSAAVTADTQGRTVVTLSFSGSETDPISAMNGGEASLADGRYTLTVFSADVSANGLALDGDANGTAGGNYVSPTDTSGGSGLHLFRLFGDATGDGVVDALDLGLFRSAFNSVAGNTAYLWYLDADNSGSIDSKDLGQFRSRFNATVF